MRIECSPSTACAGNQKSRSAPTKVAGHRTLGATRVSKAKGTRSIKPPDKEKTFSYSAVDAWNPTGQGCTYIAQPPRPQQILPKLSRPFHKGSEVRVIDGVAFYKHLRVPLRDRQAAIAAYRAGHFIPVDPLDGTRIKQAITLGNPDKIVYAPRGVFDFKALIPDKGPRSLNKEEPPMLQPSVTYQWEEVRWVDEGQPRTERARDVDGLPVSPKTWPKLGEFSYDELERVVAWAGRELGSGCVE